MKPRLFILGLVLGLSSLSCLAPACAAEDILQVAPGIWRIAGENAGISVANHGVIVNTGVIATGEGVIIIDPGPSAQRATALAGIVRTLTAEPVRWIIDTHAHPENVLANNGFPAAEVIASAPAAALMKSRCAICLQRLTEQLGEAAMHGTTSRVPTRLVADGETAVLGNRRLRFAVFARAHTQGDLAVLLPEAGVLFAGGLVNDRRVPDLREAGLSAWIDALDALAVPAVRVVVPGHGSATDAGVIGRFAAYLLALRAICDRDIAERGNAGSSGVRLALPAFKDWAEYPQQHPLNVAHAYREREDAQLMGTQ